ncbi:MAG: carotenoid oxygenase family protein [Deltaproteobacteria bacterium]|nr:carotenoid oxygenase family protein [Deltaproteobacteria bacterium]
MSTRTYAMRLLEGTWPSEIRGHHWINGPGTRLPWHQHSIFAPGVLQRLDLQPDSAGELRWHVRDTHAYDVQAVLAHLDVFEDPRAFQVLGGPLFTGLNNSFFLIDDRVFLTADFNRPWEIDPQSMQLATVVGRVHEWGGSSRLALLSPPVPTTAHPYYDRRDGLLYSYSCRVLPRDGTSLAATERPLRVAAWDGHGAVRTWEVPGAGLTQYVHEVGATRHFVLLLESSSFQIEPGIEWLGLPKQAPHLPVSNVYAVRKADLTEENRRRGVPFVKVEIPVEAFHLLADYEDDGRHVDLWLTHGNGLDFLAANTPQDVHWKTGEPFKRWQLDRFINCDYTPVGHYRLDLERGRLDASHRIIDTERLWGAGVWSWDPRPANPADSPLYMSWLGYDGSLVSKRLMDLYGDRPHRVLPPNQVPDGRFAPVLGIVDWRRRDASQLYTYPDGTTTLANQFIPRPGGSGGWVGVYLLSPQRDVQYWLFDAERIPDGPIARIGHPDLRPERTIHHTWSATAPRRSATYHVAVADDLGDDWRHLPEPYRRVVETGLRCAETRGS